MASRSGFLQWWRQWFPKREAAQTTPDTVCDSPMTTLPMLVPARGEVFDFHLYVRLHWSSPTHSLHQLENLSHARSHTALATIRMAAWEIARMYEPGDTGPAEHAVNNRFAQGLCYDDAYGRTIRCDPTVRVLMDPRLREHLVQYRLEQAQQREEHRLGLDRARMVEERTQSWLNALRTFEGAPESVDGRMSAPNRDGSRTPEVDEAEVRQRQFLLPFAASLSDQQFAEVTTDLSETRRERAIELVQVLRAARGDHQQVGLFEFARAYDKAYEMFCQQMGLRPYSFMLADFNQGTDE
ncbi:hypothetical protein [Cryptosporangium aurantiacum]|uniref:Uncharacterized protein n=1 Tax=Cryptosporangium aurantiacum TaxID=134849 RepID=A0A1M7K3G3_9ACTN|nr:hypothetical protein [Cryptosporangium aurantiacum]SHM59503.1 hypothetical protein SAMN05443668_101983 [Cryptosporangium aurantiacum]